MNRTFKMFAVLCLVLVFTSIPFLAVSAAPVQPQEVEPAAPTLADLLKTLESLSGVALFFAALVNAGKRFFPQWFPDDSAPTYNLVFQSIGLFALVALQLSGKFDLVPLIDQTAGTLAVIITSILALVYQLWLSRKGHENVLAGLPVIGKSYSGRQAGEPFAAELTVENAKSGVGYVEL